MTAFLSVIGLLAVGQGILLTVLLLARKTNHTANLFLGALVGVLSVAILYAVYVITGTYRSFPHLVGLTYPFPLLYGPLWYLHARSLIHGKEGFRKIDLLHFLPFGFAFALILPYFLADPEWKIALMDNFAQRIPFVLSLGSILMTIQGMFYLILVVRLLRRHLQRLKDFFSEIENVSLRWLRNLSLLFAVVWLNVGALQFLRLFGTEVSGNINPVVAVGVSVIVFAAGYFGLRQQELFEPPDLSRKPLLAEQPSPIEVPQAREQDKYKKSGLSRKRHEEILASLKDLLECQKRYLSSALTLKDLAEELSVSEHNLSEVINTDFGQTFFDLINGYRVREVQARLKDPAHSQFTLIAIAFDSGFNSKSSFNSVFKKHTGLTPTAFKQQLAHLAK